MARDLCTAIWAAPGLRHAALSRWSGWRSWATSARGQRSRHDFARHHVDELLERAVNAVDLPSAPEALRSRVLARGYHPGKSALVASARPDRVQKRAQVPVAQIAAEEQEVLLGQLLEQPDRNELRHARRRDARRVLQVVVFGN